MIKWWHIVILGFVFMLVALQAYNFGWRVCPHDHICTLTEDKPDE